MKAYKVLFALLCILLIFSGCNKLSPSPHEAVAQSEEIVMTTQFPVYDKSIDEIHVTIINGSAEEIDYGVPWEMEVFQDGQWMAIPFVPETVWTEPLYLMMPGGTDQFIVRLDLLDYRFHEGEYRVLKEISGQMYAAAFAIGESPVTAKTPYGYDDVTKLPKDYTAAKAAEDGLVVFYKDGTCANEDKLARFLQDYIHGIPAQVQIAVEEDSLTVVDLLVNQMRPQVRYIHYSPADKTVLTEGYAQYLHSNRSHLYLANGVLVYGREALFTLPDPVLRWDWEGRDELVADLMAYQKDTKSVVGAWSPDGLRRIWDSRDDVLHFYVEIHHGDNKGGRGYTGNLLSEDGPVKIVDFLWTDETSVLIVADLEETSETGYRWYGTFDTEAETLVSHTTSLYPPTWVDGVLVFQD